MMIIKMNNPSASSLQKCPPQVADPPHLSRQRTALPGGNPGRGNNWHTEKQNQQVTLTGFHGQTGGCLYEICVHDFVIDF